MTLYNRIAQALKNNNETWNDVVRHDFSQDDLNRDATWNLPYFYLWTANHVYTDATDSDDGDWIISCPRNPPVKSVDKSE